MLTPPLASLPNIALTSWTNDRMPDMLWAVLVRKYHQGEIGYAIFRDTLSWLQKNKSEEDVSGVGHTDIATYSKELRLAFINKIVACAGTNALKPLLLFDKLPAYSDWKDALGAVDLDQEAAYGQLAEAVGSATFHQTQEATDVRWVRLMGAMIGGRVFMRADTVDKIIEYPYKYDQRSVRPTIRATEMTISMRPEKSDANASTNEWSIMFWKHLQDTTGCIPQISNQQDDIIDRYKSERDDKKYYNTILPKIRGALVLHCLETSSTTGVDPRHESVFGLALYALDVFIENVILTVGATSSGRVNARIIFETYMTLKYLISQEQVGKSSWDIYRNYGSGQASLIDRKYKEGKHTSSMVDPSVVNYIANEDKWQEYVPINLGNWDASDLRSVSISVGEKELYDKYYPYTSGYIHANWGAVREASMQTCLNPLHRLHRIPQFGLPVLPSSTEDCRIIMNKILELVDELYPSFGNRIHCDPSRLEDKKLMSHNS